MERIVQLTEFEYDKLSEQAQYNQNKIEQIAEELYKEKGIYSIKLTIDTYNDIEGFIKFRIYSYINERDANYKLSFDDSKKIISTFDEVALKMMQRKFGKLVDNINLHNQNVDKFEKWKSDFRFKFIGFTMFGWLAAVASIFAICLK